MSIIIATDVGGTCTDTVIFSAGEPVRIGKALSTPPDYGAGVLDSVERAVAGMDATLSQVLADTRLFIHGSTIVDNTLLTQSGAETGLITTKGFEDTLVATRGAYGRWSGLTEEQIKHPVMTDRPTPLVPRARTVGVAERVDYKGAVIRLLDETETERAIRFLIEKRGVEAIAVCLLWSFQNQAHEHRIRDILADIAPGTYVTLSSEVAPVPGEYERASTTVINAYTGRIARDYLAGLYALLQKSGYDGPLMVMQGYGGLLPASEAGERAVGMLECGPAAGVIGSRRLGEVLGDSDVIAADMGGTTFKVGVIQDGQIEYAREPLVNRYHYIAPKIEIVSIGAGGGSIVSIDERTARPRVGPQSAGADPGPVCYGRGGDRPTLTDVMMLIGYMDPGSFLGGSMRLDTEAARHVFETRIARPLGIETIAAAIGIYRIAAAQITDLIREITVERGLDPREFVLHAFGGSCPMICGMFAADLQVKRVVIPYTASVYCAFGLISADIVHEYATTRPMPAPDDPEAINRIYEPMTDRALLQLRAEGFSGDAIHLDWSIDLRYARQVHEVTTPVRGTGPMDQAALRAVVDDFETLYERKYGKGSAFREAGIEMTLFRLTARGLLDRPKLDGADLGAADPAAARTGRREIFVDARDGLAPADIYDFDRLSPGNVVEGPAVIHTPITTIVLQDRQIGRMDAYRNIVLEFI